MVDFIVGILNSIGSGVGDDLVADLLKTPAEYNAGMYQLSLTVARSAVKPIASTILAIMCVLELARVSTRADGDRELGVKLVAMAMFKLTLVFTAAQHSELMLQPSTRSATACSAASIRRRSPPARRRASALATACATP